MRARVAILVWIAVIVAATLFIARQPVDTDMTAFLPRSASPGQRILVDQFRDGVVSRLVLVAVEGVPAARLAAISKRMAAQLLADDQFAGVQNGEESGFDRDRNFLWTNRYLLSDRLNASLFTPANLHAALERDLAELASAAGFLMQRTLAADPTGEMLHLIEQQQGDGGGPARHDGVWTSADDTRALMLVRLHAAASDIDGAQRALSTIRSSFTDAAPRDRDARLVMTGPPIFAVAARDRIRSDAMRLSALASLLVASALLAVYRSPRVLILAFVPVISGALVGIAAVGLVFRSVHGITLGFGATLIGEGVDYAVYLFTQTTPDSPVEVTMRRIWPTLRLGVLTSICGFAAMLLSSFEGFAQLGLFTSIGLAVAVCVTRWVLPTLLPARFAGVRQSRAITAIATAATGARSVRWVIPLLAAVAVASLILGKGAFWSDDLASLSPLSPAEQQLDQSLRRDMQAPDTAWLVVIRRSDQEAALQAAERLTALLAPVIRQGSLVAVDSPTRYLPSVATQRARQAVLPDPATLQVAVAAAAADLPFQPGLFAPFITAIDTARSSRLIDRTALDGTSLSLKLDQLLLHRPDGWVAMLSLRGVTSPATIAQAIAGQPDDALINLKTETARLLAVYLQEGINLALLGAVAIGLLLAVRLRSLPRLIAVTTPLAAAVVVTLALLRLGGHPLSIFNLFGVLLVVAIGSNYCLFFDQQRNDLAGMPRVLASLLLANVCTVAGFGVLALSQTPVLHDLGVPVAIGTFLSLLFATVVMSPARNPASPDAAPC